MALSRKDIGVIKMLTNPPDKIINSGYRIISLCDGFIYEFEKTKWVKKNKAERFDYKELPQI